MNASTINALSKNAPAIALGIGVVIIVLFVTAKRTVTAAANTFAGLVTGNNALTRGTPYEGAGVLGTAGAAMNAASGGTFQALGERVSSWFAPNVSDKLVTYTVLFPNGARGAINSELIDRNGYFTNLHSSAAPINSRWRIGINQSGIRVAIPQ